MIEKDLLYTNSSPNASFTSKTLSLGDLSDYAMIEIICRYNTSEVAFQVVQIYRFSDVQQMMTQMYADVSNQRKAWRTYELTWSTGSLWVGTGKYNNKNANDSLYPVYIYGIKGKTRSMV